MGRKKNLDKMRNFQGQWKSTLVMEGASTSYYKGKVLVNFEPVKDISRIIDAQGS